MDPEFLDLYNRELKLLNEQAREFADEYPGIAERLGGLLEDRIDPLIGGLLEGAAFLAARVQLKLKHEFPEFTNNLLEHLVPHYLAPTPSMMLVKVIPTFGDQALRSGHPIPRGSYLDAAFRQLDRQIACRYRLCGDITIWPFELTGAEYLSVAGATAGARIVGGPRCARWHPPHLHPPRHGEFGGRVPDNEAFKKPEMMFAGCRTNNLPLYFAGRKPMRWPSTSSFSPTAAGFISAVSIRSAIRSFIQRPRSAFIRSASSARMRCFPTITGCSRDSITTRVLYVSAQVPRLRPDWPG